MIGVGIVTCNRPDFLNKCLSSIPEEHRLVVVNDGKNIDLDSLDRKKSFEYIHNKNNLGVGKSKNILFKKLLEWKCDDIFLVEDDIIVKNSIIFEKYIDARNKTGIQHFNFGYHGPANKGGYSKGTPRPRLVIDYGDTKIALNEHSVGAFCYYTREALEDVGLIDEGFTNAFEHVDHDYRLFKGGYTTPYWYFADIADSYEYLDEIECSEFSSTIRNRPDWMDNIKRGAMLFEKKHGYLPAWQNFVPDTPPEDLKKILKEIHKKHAK